MLRSPSEDIVPWTRLAEAIVDQLVQQINLSPESHVQEIKMLSEMGLDINYRPNKSTSILYSMIMNNLVEGSKMCLEWQASVDDIDGRGRTAAQVAAEHQCTEILDLLEENVSGKTCTFTVKRTIYKYHVSFFSITIFARHKHNFPCYPKT